MKTNKVVPQARTRGPHANLQKPVNSGCGLFRLLSLPAADSRSRTASLWRWWQRFGMIENSAFPAWLCSCLRPGRQANRNEVMLMRKFAHRRRCRHRYAEPSVSSTIDDISMCQKPVSIWQPRYLRPWPVDRWLCVPTFRLVCLFQS